MTRIRKGRKGNDTKLITIEARLTSWMYPSSRRILIVQSCATSEGKCTTALFALWAVASRESNSLDILEPSAAASGVSSKIAYCLSMRGITLCR